MHRFISLFLVYTSILNNYAVTITQKIENINYNIEKMRYKFEPFIRYILFQNAVHLNCTTYANLQFQKFNNIYGPIKYALT